jgi:hypothetical protein
MIDTIIAGAPERARRGGLGWGARKRGWFCRWIGRRTGRFP